MKIVHVVLGKANPERANGVNRVAHGLATAQVALGARVEVWGITPTPHAPTSARAYHLRTFRAQRVPWRLTDALELALDEARAECVFHLHGGYHPEFHSIARRLWRRGIPWAFTPHGALHPEVVRGRWSKRGLYVACFDAFLLKRARAVQVFAASEVAAVTRFAQQAHVVVLPNGVEVLTATPSHTIAGPSDRPVFGFCGRLDARVKGLDVLLDAFAAYRARGGRGSLALLGDGSDRTALEARARRLGIASRVEFAGFVAGHAMHARLAGLDIFVHPSRHEGMPTAVLEAAALGLPCVLTRETNLVDAFAARDACFVLERHDPDVLAALLADCEALVDSGAARQIGSRARAIVQREFNWIEIARRSLVEIYADRAVSTPASVAC